MLILLETPLTEMYCTNQYQLVSQLAYCTCYKAIVASLGSISASRTKTKRTSDHIVSKMSFTGINEMPGIKLLYKSNTALAIMHLYWILLWLWLATVLAVCLYDIAWITTGTYTVTTMKLIKVKKASLDRRAHVTLIKLIKVQMFFYTVTATLCNPQRVQKSIRKRKKRTSRSLKSLSAWAQSCLTL